MKRLEYVFRQQVTIEQRIAVSQSLSVKHNIQCFWINKPNGTTIVIQSDNELDIDLTLRLGITIGQTLTKVTERQPISVA